MTAPPQGDSCPLCRGQGWVCEEHPNQPYPHRHCGAPGIPCGECNAQLERPRVPPDWRSQLQDYAPPTANEWNELSAGRNEQGVQWEVHNDSQMFTASMISPDGTASVYLAGKPERNEWNSLPAAKLLAACWSRVGNVRWTASDLPDSDPRKWIDAILTSDSGTEKHVQVRRVAPGETLGRVAKEKRFESGSDVDELIANIWSAYEAKALSAAKNLLLLLDGRQPGVYSFQNVVDRFREKYGARLQSESRWAEVWIVGYGVHSASRLDGEAAIENR